MKLEDIGFYTLSDTRAAQASSTSPLWRCELLVTNRCNFKCPYCRGFSMQQEYLGYERAVWIIDQWAEHGLKNIRFSGGEPTLHPLLPTLCYYARNTGIERVAISTNGAAHTDLYRKLLGVGVNDFSVSLDACCDTTFGKMSGRGSSLFNTVRQNIAFLAPRTYVTIGTVITPENAHELPDIIALANDLGVADVRVITSAQWNGEIAIPDSISNMPILRYRSTNAKNGRSVRGILPEDSKRCRLVLDDMCVVDDKHYPCIIHFREGGAPIGEITGDMTEVRRARTKWSTEHNTHNDPICSKNCLDVCVDYNNKFPPKE